MLRKKGHIIITPLNLPELPVKKHTEYDMEKILHRARVVARKRQIEMIKLDQDIPFAPLSICQYQTPERRINILKVAVNFMRLFLP